MVVIGTGNNTIILFARANVNLRIVFDAETPKQEYNFFSRGQTNYMLQIEHQNFATVYKVVNSCKTVL